MFPFTFIQFKVDCATVEAEQPENKSILLYFQALSNEMMKHAAIL